MRGFEWLTWLLILAVGRWDITSCSITDTCRVRQTLHLGCVAHPGLGDFQLASSAGLYLPCVRNTLVQRLDLAAGEGVCGGEAGASAARGSDGALVVSELQKDCKMASHD